MWMVLPDQAGSLQGSCSVSCNLLAANDPGIGSGWQQSKQNWTLLAVVGHWIRMACRNLFCAEGAPLQPLLFPQHTVFSPKTHGPKIRTFGTHAAKSMKPQIQTCSVDPGLFPGLGCGGSLDEGHDTDAMWMVLPVLFSVAPTKTHRTKIKNCSVDLGLSLDLGCGNALEHSMFCMPCGWSSLTKQQACKDLAV